MNTSSSIAMPGASAERMTAAAETVPAFKVTWNNDGRRVAVEIEKLDGLPAICVTTPDPYPDTWDDLTADEARALGRFLEAALTQAAVQLEKMEARS